MASGFGALILYNSIGVWELMELKQTLLLMGTDITSLNNEISDAYSNSMLYNFDNPVIQRYNEYTLTNMFGASGALFGVLAGFAVLFPNTELMLLFPPIPIKAKFLIGAYLLFEIYSSIKMQHDQIAHLAHVGGAIVGISLVLIWRKTDKKNFW